MVSSTIPTRPVRRFPYNYNPKNPVYPGTSVAACLTTTCPPSFLPVPNNMKTHVQYSWNFGIQRQFTQSLFASATYIGTHIIHIWNAVELNPGVFIPGGNNTAATLTQRRALNLANPSAPPSPTSRNTMTAGPKATMVCSWPELGAREITSLNANYTWSHCIGLAPITLLNPGQTIFTCGLRPEYWARRPQPDVGNCVQDRRHIANLTLVYQTPKYTATMARVLASGWTMSSSFQARSGAPVTVLTGATPDPVTGFGGNSPGQPASQSTPLPT